MTTEQTQGQPETRPSEVRSDALLGCPFCGGDARYGENTDEGLEWIECSKCNACTTAMAPLMQGVKELLAEAWNRRQPNSGQQPRRGSDVG